MAEQCAVQGWEHLQGKRILLTGATGFVGRHVVRALAPMAEAGQIEVSCLVRASSRRNTLPSFVRFFEADLASGKGLEDALQGQHMVVHMAALLFGARWQDYLSNVQASSILAKAIAEQQEQGHCQRVLLVSSLAATGSCAKAPGVGDDALPKPISAYGWSKYLSEEAMGRHCGKSLVVLRPPIIYGPEDKGFFPYFAMAKKGLVVSPGMGRDFPVSIMHVQDVVQAILCTLKPEAQGVYHCNDTSVRTIRQVGEIMAELMGKKARCIHMPLAIMSATSLLSTAWGILTQPFGLRAPSWNRDKYREAREAGWLCDSSRLQKELGFEPMFSLRHGLEHSIDAYKKAGWL